MWTEERVSTAHRLWKEGKSARLIAEELGGVTRNAVIGRLHRDGAPKRLTVTRVPRPKHWAPAQRASCELRRAEARIKFSIKRPDPPKPRKIGVPLTDPSVLAAAALLGAAKAAELRCRAYRGQYA